MQNYMKVIKKTHSNSTKKSVHRWATKKSEITKVNTKYCPHKTKHKSARKYIQQKSQQEHISYTCKTAQKSTRKYRKVHKNTHTVHTAQKSTRPHTQSSKIPKSTRTYQQNKSQQENIPQNSTRHIEISLNMYQYESGQLLFHFHM